MKVILCVSENKISVMDKQTVITEFSGQTLEHVKLWLAKNFKNIDTKNIISKEVSV